MHDDDAEMDAGRRVGVDAATRTDDPGWGLTWRTLLHVLPGSSGYTLSGKHGTDDLVALRQVFVAFCTAVGLLGVVLPLVAPRGGSGAAAAWFVAALAVFVILQMLVARPLTERPLPCDGIAQAYRQRFFVRLAFAETSALLGFVAALILKQYWIYYVALAFTAVGFARAAPTRKALRREQEALVARGCGASIVAELRHSVRD